MKDFDKRGQIRREREKQGKVKKKCEVDCETVKDKTREIERRGEDVKKVPITEWGGWGGSNWLAEIKEGEKKKKKSEILK